MKIGEHFEFKAGCASWTVCCRFFTYDNGGLFEEYDRRITANAADYEAYVGRAFARVGALWNATDVNRFAAGCGIDYDPDTGFKR